MSTETLLFYLFGAVTAGGALALVLVKNLLHAALALLATLLGVAAIYVLLSADLLAVVQLMVYVGGVLVLIIFGIMLMGTSATGAPLVESHNRIWGSALFLVVLGGLLYVIVQAFVGLEDTRPVAWVEPASTVKPTGMALLTTYVLPFELVSILLLVALVGAAYLAAPLPKKE